MENKHLKVCVLLNSDRIPLWQYSLVETITTACFSEVLLVRVEQDKSLMQKNERSKGNFILYFHLLLDKLLFGRKADFDQLKDVSSLLTEKETVKPGSPGTYQIRLTDTTGFPEIAQYKPDVILQLAERKLPDQVLALPRFGVWSFQHCAAYSSKGVPAGYWEVIKQKSIIVSVLKAHSLSFPDGRVIHRAAMLPEYLSITRSQNASYWRIALAVPRILEGVNRYGETYFQRLIAKFNTEAPVESTTTVPAPTLPESAKHAVQHFSYLLTRLWRKAFYVDHWSILYKNGMADETDTSIKSYTFLTQPADRFWADPFVISRPDKHYLFVEEMLYKQNKGCIAVIEVSKAGKVLHHQKVLEKYYHLSYPFLLTHAGSYYMIPETGGNRTIELYKCTGFPGKWEFVMNLMEDVLAADVTLFFYNHKWWMFCCLDATGRNIGMLDELHLFYADSLFTKDWHSHPCNPIQTDVRVARPAGKIFEQANKIYRPSQDCSDRYGKAINLNEILTLTETAYEEVLVSKIHADKGMIGTHTLNFGDNLTIVDGFSYRRRGFLRRL